MHPHKSLPSPQELGKGQCCSVEYCYINGENVYTLFAFSRGDGEFVLQAKHFSYGKQVNAYSKQFIASKVSFGLYLRQRFNICKTEASWLSVFNEIIL